MKPFTCSRFVWTGFGGSGPQVTKCRMYTCTCLYEKSRPGVEPATSRIWQHRQHWGNNPLLLYELAYSTHGMVERGIGVCLRIILSVLSIARPIVNPSSNNRIETHLDSWGTTIPVTPAQCSESFNHSYHTCRPSAGSRSQFHLSKCLQRNNFMEGSRLTCRVNRMRLLNVRYILSRHLGQWAWHWWEHGGIIPPWLELLTASPIFTRAKDGGGDRISKTACLGSFLMVIGGSRDQPMWGSFCHSWPPCFCK
jgi:hypothetical protein